MDSVDYLHETEQIAHRDLKLENILLDAKNNIKITDFGACVELYLRPGLLSTYIGTESYMAPEIIEEKSYDGKQIDMYSIGVIHFIMATGRFPFKRANDSDFYFNLIKNGKRDEFFALHNDNLSTEF